MGRSWIIVFLLISALSFLSIPQGYGRNVVALRRDLDKNPLHKLQKRELMVMVEMDYQDPGANTNPRNGAFFYIPNSAPPPAPVRN